MGNRRRRKERTQLADIAPHFDAAFYLENNPDVAEAGFDPALHYLRLGWKEGRAPNAWFDGQYYLSIHQDVAALDINPLLHYARHGCQEERSTSSPETPPARPHDAVRQVIEAAIPVREVAAHYLRTVPGDTLAPADLLSRLLQGAPQGVVLSFSHDDYAANFGGVQRLIENEAEQLNANNWRYLHAYPTQPLPILSNNTDPSSFFYNIRLDGHAIGAISAVDLLVSMGSLREAGLALELVVHHFMGHSPEIITKICEGLAIERPLVWIHDFYSLCESHNLLRNGWTFCNAPRLDSTGCRICVHGPGRIPHFSRMLRFFSALPPIILAPSESAFGLWRDRGLPYHDAHIVPIAQIVKSGQDAPRRDRARLRVAFIGQSLHSKGWTAFRELVDHSANADFVEFYHLGMQIGETSIHPKIRFVPVFAGRDDRDAMARALAENSIDIVVIWAAWPESFCYAAHEALAAGAAIVTNRQAGNVPSVISLYAPSRGMTLAVQAELFELFQAPERLKQLCDTPAFLGVVLPYESSAHIILKRRVMQAASGVGSISLAQADVVNG